MKEPESARAGVRRFDRISAVLIVSYQVAPEIPPAFTLTYDIGPGGCGILTDVMLEDGTDVALSLELRAADVPPLHLQGTVRWSRFDAPLERYRTGIAFARAAPEREALLAQYVTALQGLDALGF